MRTHKGDKSIKTILLKAYRGGETNLIGKTFPERNFCCTFAEKYYQYDS